MPYKSITAHNLNRAKELLAQGLFLDEIAERVGHSPDYIARKLRELGVVTSGKDNPRRAQWCRLRLDSAAISKAYIGGESELSISLRLKVSRPVIRKRLVECGIAIRNGSEANLLRMSRMTPEERCALTSASHDGRRGMSEADNRRMAELRAQSRTRKIGFGEEEFSKALLNSGLPIDCQKPCGVYNIDIAVGTVAVELFAVTIGPQHRKRFAERFKCLTDRGYSILYIVFAKRALLPQMNELVSFVERTYREPSVLRKNWVIRCGADHSHIPHGERDHVSVIRTAEKFFYTVSEVDARGWW
jgi:hypothetical protein